VEGGSGGGGQQLHNYEKCAGQLVAV